MPRTSTLIRRASLAGGLAVALPLATPAQTVRKDAAAQPPAADPARTLRAAAVRKAVDTIRATNAWTSNRPCDDMLVVAARRHTTSLIERVPCVGRPMAHAPSHVR